MDTDSLLAADLSIPENASALIDALGGTTTVSELMEVGAPSVSEWRIYGIPKARQQTLRLLRKVRPRLFRAA